MSPCDYNRPSTWVPYKKNLCSDCHADCCRLPVEVHSSEFVILGLCVEEELLELNTLVKKLKKEFKIKLFDYKTKTATLAQQVDGSCLFLNKDRKCTVYLNRPKTCRDFPQIGPKPGYCPYNTNY